LEQSLPIKKRKRRSDRTHIVYQLTNETTGQIYIGITVVTGKAFKRSLTERWKRHVSRTKHESHEWPICKSIREYGEQAFTREILHTIRGKKQAHSLETLLIREFQPQLNTISII
tara:strand:+ start:717 stop:1061 length:345 start_codon:yes stop_codon:yes gene_type:complete